MPHSPPPLNGRVSASGGTATYTCFTGYTLSVSSRRTCVSSGRWSGNAPTCQRGMFEITLCSLYFMLFYPLTLSNSLPTVQCPVLPNPSNGGVISPSRAVGSLATYTCNPGYTLSGSSRRTCLTNGVWSASQPTCKQPQCHQSCVYHIIPNS